MNDSPFFASLLTDLAVIRATGEDAASFLHGQLTQDIVGLAPGQARLAAYCTPKGRVLASLIIWRDPSQPDDLVALVKADVAAALVKRLSMFVLRAKAKLEVSSDTVSGISLPATEPAAPVGGVVAPAAAAAWSVVQTDDGVWVCAPSASEVVRRWWLVAQNLVPENAGAQAAWQAADIAAGLPWVESATQDLFIPQTLNLDLIEGVNFTKGCYPGQEVVARSHYRGTVKRRMAYGVADSAVETDALAGSDIYDAERPESPSGRVVNAAAHNGRTHLLLEVHLADMGTAQYRLGSVEGVHIALHPLPYHIDHSDEK